MQCKIKLVEIFVDFRTYEIAAILSQTKCPCRQCLLSESEKEQMPWQKVFGLINPSQRVLLLHLCASAL